MPDSIGGEGSHMSSRGSTKGTEFDAVSEVYDERDHYMYQAGGNARTLPPEEEKESDGGLILTNAYLRHLLKSDTRLYFRTPELNEKLYLHYKGFSYMKNLSQFKELKCLYFEGNGCRSLLGLENNLELRCLFIQENVIETIEGLDNLKELRQMSLADNMIKIIGDGLEHCDRLDSLYLKHNRLGKDERGDVFSLSGLLKCPSLTTIDISHNSITDPAILDEVLVKMPNLHVLYCQGNDFIRKIDYYRKTVIAKIPTLKYLDDRPVFEEDRRRAEAFAEGGMKAEREMI